MKTVSLLKSINPVVYTQKEKYQDQCFRTEKRSQTSTSEDLIDRSKITKESKSGN